MGSRRPTRTGLLAVPVLVLALAGCTPATASRVAEAPAQAASEELASALSGFLDETVGVAGATGAVAGVWSPWGGSWEGAVGWESDERTTALTTDAHLRLGTGGTEAMTCDVVLALADSGRVDLDADVGETLRSLPGIDGLTLRELCAHTSGLADFRSALWPTVLQNPRGSGRRSSCSPRPRCAAPRPSPERRGPTPRPVRCSPASSPRR